MATSPPRPTPPAADCTRCRARVDGLCQTARPGMPPAVAAYKSCDRHIAAGQDLFGIGQRSDAVYNVVDGWVYLYHLLEDGRQQILHFALPGAMLGFHPVRGVPATYGVQALTDAVVCVIPRDNLDRLFGDHPAVAVTLAGLIARDRSLTYGHLTSIGRHRARERVAQLLLELFIRARAQWPGHRVEEMQLPLTQEHIGDATGLTGVHVNRVLRELRHDGIAEFHYRRLRILDPDRLVDVAGIDPHLLMQWTAQEGMADDGWSAALAPRVRAVA
ncbi:Crp/Fnr family transcriptional regulator [Aquibium sp. A9E412]|uniref:Crp/Fnr family transcriptional regulator n=1 Tax=Aquibium sp. A9E412 TaxID=2976767 RepID=UPI0025B2325F|nr:Crp/Fnr family transcriptional regulator [Aquibium sp. A9E412]MDN2565562.1 Crp/Fnr family transcriptional regulator [Aquibium sp. A9E412]